MVPLTTQKEMIDQTANTQIAQGKLNLLHYLRFLISKEKTKWGLNFANNIKY